MGALCAGAINPHPASPADWLWRLGLTRSRPQSLAARTTRAPRYGWRHGDRAETDFGVGMSGLSGRRKEDTRGPACMTQVLTCHPGGKAESQSGGTEQTAGDGGGNQPPGSHEPAQAWSTQQAPGPEPSSPETAVQRAPYPLVTPLLRVLHLEPS